MALPTYLIYENVIAKMMPLALASMEIPYLETNFLNKPKND